MEVVGEALLSATFEVLFSKLATSDLLKFARQEQVHRELKKWEEKLLEIHEVLIDAEEKQITKESVKAWLGDLRDLAYDVEDVLDEFAYQVMRRKLGADAEGDVGSTSKVCKFLPACCTSFTPFDSVRNMKMAPKIMDITRRLEEISAQKADLGLQMLKGQTEARIATHTPTPPPPLVYKPGVCGRDEDRRKILAMLKDGPLESNLSVVSIVAMGGIGKTTLAGLVFDDDETSTHFALKAWVRVSDQFDVETITRAVLRDIAPSNNVQVFRQIQCKLRDELKGKRFLIVLDDLWNEEYDQWDSLRSPFLEGAPGSKILVTTRNKNVAIMMGGHNNFYELKQLSNEDCWLVFQRHAFEHININEHQNLASIGRRIVEKCGGLPLAAKTLGGLLCSEIRQHEWEKVLDSKIWDLSDKECGIIPALRLSYNHLPRSLKRCFAYCAIFPKDYEFKQKELILLWMAEGLIEQSKDNRKIDDLGGCYFRELLSRSFFQASCSNGSLFVMHDLVNDLAQFVARETCLHLDDNLESDLQCPISKSTRHLSFTRRQYDIFKRFQRFHKVDLRTFIALPIHSPRPYNLSYKVLLELIPKLGHLRVLSLSNYDINVIPNSFGNLKHLRYLNLSGTQIECLPESIGDLYNLQTLILSWCKRLTKLPVSMGNLINLRHLDVDGTRLLEEMPSQIGKLKDLQILSNFILSKDDGLKIRELKNMSHLQEVCISKMENVVNIQDAREASLNMKQNLEELAIEWSIELDDSGNGTNQMDVLDSLQPHLNLHKLKIVSYGGPEFPRWISDALFSKMVNLILINCRKCTSLPCLGRLPLLKYLWIQGMDGVKVVGAEFYGETHLSNNYQFRSLESLYFGSMLEWEDWKDWPSSTNSLFPCLRELRIFNCPKLIKIVPSHLPSLTKLDIWRSPKLEVPLPRLPSLGELEVNKCHEMILRSGIGLTSLIELKIYNILGLTRLHEGFISFLRGLRVLEIEDCKKLTYLWENGFGLENLDYLERLKIRLCHELVSLGEGEERGLPCNLQSLEICNCSKLERLPNGWQSLACLGKLTIRGCSKLESFPKMGFPPMLRHLTIYSCEGLKCLPDGMMTTRNSSTSSSSNNRSNMCLLEYLHIQWCPSLVCFPKGELPSTLKQLVIRECEKLDSLPGGVMQPHSNNTISGGLQFLCIWCCSSLTSFPRGKFPSTLKRLKIRNCFQMESISEEMFHFTNNSLESLDIGRYPNIKNLPECLLNLREIRIEKCKNLESLPHRMQNLRDLTIIDCENLELVPDQLQSLTCLTSLVIRDCENIKIPLSRWGLASLTSLKELTISGIFPDATSFSDDSHLFFLPTALTSLSIKNLKSLESLASLSLQTLTSLERLYIDDCPKLQSFLPREGLPDTLSVLWIRHCPFLHRRWSGEKRQDWPKMAHIACAEMDGKSMFEELIS